MTDQTTSVRRAVGVAKAMIEKGDSIAAVRVLATAYVEAIGYDPFLEDPSERPASIAEVLLEWCDEVEAAEVAE